MIRLRPSGVDEILIKRVQDWYEPGPGVFIQSLTASFSPAMLFTGSTTGAWYDPSDTTTLFRDAAGTQPVTAVEQPVGLMLDKSKGLVLGPELVTNGTFDSSINGWTTNSNGSGSSVWIENSGNGAAKITNISGQATQFSQALAVTAGKTYQITANITYISGSISGNVSVRTSINASTSSNLGGQTLNAATNTGVSFYYLALSTTTVYVSSLAFTSACSYSLDNISVRELPGNHAFNSSGNSANFPVLSARYNLLTKTEDFSDAVWVKNNATITANAATAPNGTTTADALLETTTVGAHSAVEQVAAVNATYTYSVNVKSNGRNYCVVSMSDTATGDAAIGIDLTNGTTYSVTSVYGVGSWTGISAVVEPVANDFYRIAVTGTKNAGSNIQVVVRAMLDSSTFSYAGDTSKGLYLWGADLRVVNDTLNQPSYQRVNTATDYDTVGFKPAEIFDGVDDNLIASAGGGSTTAFFWCSAIRVGKVGAVQTLFSDAGTNTGYRVRINASNQLELSAGNGTAYTTVATTATLSIGQRAALTAWHDGTNLNVQINNGTVHQAAFATATAGTAQFTIGKDNNAASNFFAGRLYEKVYTKDNVPSSAQITSTKTYVANVAGIILS